jgi:hypothetical protein
LFERFRRTLTTGRDGVASIHGGNINIAIASRFANTLSQHGCGDSASSCAGWLERFQIAPLRLLKLHQEGNISKLQEIANFLLIL